MWKLILPLLLTACTTYNIDNSVKNSFNDQTVVTRPSVTIRNCENPYLTCKNK